MEQYAALAEFYDRLNHDLDYAAWADFLCAAFERYETKKTELVLDLACGTGSMSLSLAQKGLDVIGVDLSPEMLSIATQRAYDAGKSILFLRQDMRNFELYGTVDAVVCCLDSINYLLKTDDLRQCLQCVHLYLNPDGLFIFDVNTPYKFTTIYADNAYVLEDDTVYCGWQNYYHEKSKLCDFYLTFFAKQKNGFYRRYEETQRERMYSEKTLRSVLTECGFEILALVADYAFKTPEEKDERWYFICKGRKE